MSSFEKPQVTRPASLVIRFTNPGRYQNAINLYTSLLGEKPVMCQPGVFASFQVGSARKPRKRDIELRLELHQGDETDLRGHTLIYWQIKPCDNEPANEAIKAKLRELGYTIENNEGQSIKSESRFLMTDGFDNFFGGHPNPPFPPGGGGGFLRRKHHFPAPGLLVGLLGGLALALLLPGALGLRRASR